MTLDEKIKALIEKDADNHSDYSSQMTSGIKWHSYVDGASRWASRCKKLIEALECYTDEDGIYETAASIALKEFYDGIEK